MAMVSRLLGATTLVFAFGSTVQAETLAGANAFACGVDAPSAYSSGARSSTRAGGYPGAGLDPEMPSMVKLRIVYEYADRIEIDHCGGTVIDSQWVVTAAHCVAADASWDRVEVLAGDTNLDGGNVIRRVSRNAVCHSGFEFQGLKDDVALIRLEEPLPPEIVPAQIDQQNATSARQGSQAIVAGWPVTGSRAGDRRLNKTAVNLVDVQVPGYITAIGARGGVEGVCRGESGGPLLTRGRYGLQLAGVLSGIQPGTANGAGEECMLPGYEMYFTPMAAFRGWIDNVRNICSRNPAICAGSGGTGMMLASAPSYKDGAPSAQGFASQPSYTAVAQSQPAYVQAAPTYAPAAPQPTYVSVTAAQPQYVDVSSQYVGYSAGYTLPSQPAYQQTQPIYQDVTYQQTQPVYQDVTYQVALNVVAPTVDYATSNYIDLGYVDVTNSYSPAVTQYQDYSYQTAATTYVDATPQYQNVGSYDSTYAVAYVNQPINVGSVFQLHAW